MDMKIIRAIKKADAALQLIGDIGINSADFTGELILRGIGAPSKVIKSKAVRRTVGTCAIAIAYGYAFPKPYLGFAYMPLVLPPAGFTEVYKTDLSEERVRAMAAQIAISTALASNPPETAAEIPAGQLPAPGIVISLYDRADVDTSTQLQPSSALLAALAAEKNDERGLSELEFQHLRKIVRYTGQTPIRQAFMNMAPSAQRKFYGLFAEYNRMTGEQVIIKSAWRPITLQAKLKGQYGSRAAGKCGSPHAIGAVDIDRDGEVSRQVAKMQKLGLLNKYGLWVPPFVGEAWHVEDPESVYFRFWKKRDTNRRIYTNYVCSGETGVQHHAKRLRDGHFTITDAYRRIEKMADDQLAKRGISGNRAARIKEYLLLSVRSESMYGRQMISKTGAKGWWQFIDSVADQYKLKYPMQLDEAMRATIDLLLDNESFLVKHGIDPSVENLYKAHVIGGTGLSWAMSAQNGASLKYKEETKLKNIIAVQFPTNHLNLYYNRNGNTYSLKPGVNIGDVALAFNQFFDDRLQQYRIDNAYVKEQTNA